MLTNANIPSSDTEETIHPSARLNETAATRQFEERSRMVRLTVNLPSNLVEQIRNAVYWTPGLTVAWMIARAVRASLDEMESANQGPFPKRARPLRAGRPRMLGQSMEIQHPKAPRTQIGSARGGPITRMVSTPTIE